MLNFVLILSRSWKAKKALKFSTEYLKDRIWKFKQYLNYIVIIINQNILRTFLNLQKKKKKKKNEKIHIKQTEFLSKIPNIKKISNEHFNLCEAEISLDEIIKFR